MCHISHVICHVSRVTCNIFIFILFFGVSGGACQWRVCCQRGLPRLVFHLKASRRKAMNMAFLLAIAMVEIRLANNVHQRYSQFAVYTYTRQSRGGTLNEVTIILSQSPLDQNLIFSMSLDFIASISLVGQKSTGKTEINPASCNTLGLA